MRVLVITSCTGQKAVVSKSALKAQDFENSTRLASREDELRDLLRPAGSMYTGQQHVRAMRGVQAMRATLGGDSVRLAVLSAGYGLVQEEQLIAPYDVTFSGMSQGAIRSRGKDLAVPDAVRKTMVGHDVVFLLLGRDYLTAVDPPLVPNGDQRIVFFAGQGESRVTSGSVVVRAGRDEARRYGAGLVALKGRMLELTGAAVQGDGPRAVQQIKSDPSPATVTALIAREAGR